MTPASTGTVAEWMAELRVDPSDVIAWAAIYFDGTGQPDLYSSVDTQWTTLVTDPETLPEQYMQIYLVFHKRPAEDADTVYVEWIDGHDEFYLIGKANPVTGHLLNTPKWSNMQDRGHQVWLKRWDWMPEGWGP
jgi:hypothetical protein